MNNQDEFVKECAALDSLLSTFEDQFSDRAIVAVCITKSMEKCFAAKNPEKAFEQFIQACNRSYTIFKEGKE